MDPQIKKVADRKFGDIQSTNLFQFRRGLRTLIREIDIRGDPGRTEDVVRVLLQEKDRLERMKLAASESPLPTSVTETPDEGENHGESAAESEDPDTAMNLGDSADSHELEQQDETVCAEEDLVAVAEILKKAERVVVLVGAGISTNCGIPVSRPMHPNEQI